MSTTGHNAATNEHLRAFVERIERLSEEHREIAEDLKEVVAEAKGSGYDVKILRKVLARRKRERSEVIEEDKMLALYEKALEGVEA